MPPGVMLRRGRSSARFTFSRQAFGAPIRSQIAYSFVDALKFENELVIHREDADPIRPHESCAPYLVPLHLQPDVDSDDDDELTSNIATRPVTPEATSSSSFSARSITPETRSSSVLDDLSPLSSCPPSPTVADIPADIPSPTVTDIVQASPTTLVTYARRDRARAARAKREAAAELALRVAAAKRRLTNLVVGRPKPRRSGRLHRELSLQENSPGVYTTEGLVAIGHTIEEIDAETLTPLVDNQDMVMGLVSGAPKGQLKWWGYVMKQIGKNMGRLYRNGEFTNLGHQEATVRFGTGFGDLGPKPHRILQKKANVTEIHLILASPAFGEVAAYQNHMFELAAPTLYAHLRDMVELLRMRHGLATPFPNSVFTTCEIAFCDVPNVSRKNWESTFYGFEAITSCGDYDWKQRGGLILWDDDRIIPLRPGATVIFPGGTKRYSFIPVAPHETRYIFRQYCHASALRFVEKGRCDTDFEADASDSEVEAWETKRARRGTAAARMYSKLKDIYVC
ncbi:hypothetical protein C8F04DRAFT_1250151 [Mycena alexandri]|uniref:Uncharacterized protein n=1 Tax=Mycena alexandri TaxID=1745969 RepID=A0AAD6TF86_9AGAR|nr:hypothetical protein C8F04DRAFT_1250151 [Mycena alexandri]